jgi:16S rRNA (cytosine967-C5)-methyltransferase
MRNRSRLDWILNSSLKKGLESLNSLETNILRMGLYQIAYLDRVPGFAAVNESVNLVKRFGRKGIIGLTNAVLRDIIRNRRHLSRPDTGDKFRDAAIEYSHPEWLVKRWVNELGWEEALRLLSANNSPAPVVIRVNPLKTSPEELIVRLKEKGFGAQPMDGLPLAILVEEPAGLTSDEAFSRGHFYFQDAGAQMVGLLYRPRPEDLILDLCAAPGGKAGQALEEAGDGAELYAVDIGFHKLRRTRENFVRLGLNSWHLINGDAAGIKFSRRFDLVLADLPCSGLGVLRRRLDLRWKIGEADILRLSGLQSRILDNAAEMVEPGGALVYSTCTLTPEENARQIEGFLTRQTGFSLDRAERYLPPGAAEGGYLSVWPHRQGRDGSFAARLVRVK